MARIANIVLLIGAALATLAGPHAGHAIEAKLPVEPEVDPAAHAARMAEVTPTLVTGQARIDVPLQLPRATDSFDWVRDDEDTALVLRYRSPRSGVPRSADELAPGWALSLPRIVVDEGGSARLDGDALVPSSTEGRRQTYLRNPADHARIVFDSETDTWQRTSVSGDLYVFRRTNGGERATYRLHEVEDPHGLVWRAQWNGDHLTSVEYTLRRDPAGDDGFVALGERRTATLSWQDDTLTAVTVWLGEGGSRRRVRRYELEYEARLLTSIRLLGGTDELALPATRYTYDDRSRLVGTQNGFGARVALSYDDGNDALVTLVSQAASRAPRVATVIRYDQPAGNGHRYGRVDVRRSDSVGTAPVYERYLFYTGTERPLEIPGVFADRTTRDDPALAGRLLAVQAGPNPQEIEAESWTLWTAAPRTGGVVSAELAHAARIDRTQLNARWSLTDHFYDANGNVTRFEDHAARRVVELRYATDPTGRVHDAECWSRETRDDGTVVTSRAFFDGLPHGQVRTGDVTRIELDRNGRRVAVTTLERDNNGNATHEARAAQPIVRNRWSPSGAYRTRVTYERGDIELVWDERFGEFRSASGGGARIEHEVDGFGRSVRLTSNGVVQRERSYPVHGQLGYLVRQTMGDQRRTTFHDGWLRAVGVVERGADGAERSRTMRYTHHDRVDRTVFQSRGISEARPFHFGGDTGGDETLVEETQDWTGEPGSVRIVKEDGPALRIQFTRDGPRMELADRTWVIPEDLDLDPVELASPTDDEESGSCSSAPSDVLSQLQGDLSDLYPPGAAPQRSANGCTDVVSIGLDAELDLAREAGAAEELDVARIEYLHDRLERRRRKTARALSELTRPPREPNAPFIVVGSAGGRALIKPAPHWHVRRFFFEGDGEDAYTTFHLINRATEEERSAELPGFWFEANDPTDASLIYQQGMPRWEMELIGVTMTSAVELLGLVRFPTCTGGRSARWAPRALGKRKRIPTSDVLNLGSGDNPMEGAVNVDVRKVDGVDIVAKAEELPFRDGSFSEVNSLNPYGFNPVSRETARVMKPGGVLRVTGHASNRFAKPLSAAKAAEAGFELLEVSPIIDQHRFGVAKKVSGEVLKTDKMITATYRRLP